MPLWCNEAHIPFKDGGQGSNPCGGTNRILNQFKKVKKMFVDDLKGMTEEQVREGLTSWSWQATQEEVDRFDILYGSETYECYEGYAFYLLRERSTGKLFEVNGSHCSCYEFEGQFEPEETSVEALKMRGWWTAVGKKVEDVLDKL